MVFYAISKGAKTGIFTDWNECKDYVLGFKGAKYKKFKTRTEAENFVNGIKPIDNNNDPTSKQKDPNIINVYTDGSCFDNGTPNARAGIGIRFDHDDYQDIYKKHKLKQTNNSAELYAIYYALKVLKDEIKEGKIVNIRTDNTYSIGCLTDYGKKNFDKGWKTNIPNKDLVKKAYLRYTYLKKKNPNLNIYHVYGHQGSKDIHSKNNELADKLAKKGAELES